MKSKYANRKERAEKILNEAERLTARCRRVPDAGARLIGRSVFVSAHHVPAWCTQWHHVGTCVLKYQHIYTRTEPVWLGPRVYV